MTALKGRIGRAQGSALGNATPKTLTALKGRNSRSVVLDNTPFQGDSLTRLQIPGRCPGLSQFAPLALKSTELPLVGEGQVKTKVFQYSLRIGFLLLFFLILSRLVDVQLLAEALPHIRIEILGVAMLSYFLTIAIRAYRLQIILNMRTALIGFKDAYVITLIGFALNIFIPATLGDIAKSYYGYKIYGIKEEMLSTSLVDKIFALCSLFLIGTISGFVMGYAFLGVVSLICAVVSFIPLIFPESIPWNIVNAVLRRFQKSLDRDKLLEAFRLPPGRKMLVMGLSMAVWGWTSVYFYILCTAFPVTVSLGYVIVIMPMLTIVRLFPFTINALGPSEVAVAYFFHLIGINSTLAVVISLVANILSSVVPGTLGFLILLFSGYVRKKRGRNPALPS